LLSAVYFAAIIVEVILPLSQIELNCLITLTCVQVYTCDVFVQVRNKDTEHEEEIMQIKQKLTQDQRFSII